MTASATGLAPGYHLYETNGDGWRLAEPGGGFHRLRGPADRMSTIAAALREGTDPDRLRAIGDDATALAEALASRGALRPLPARKDARSATTHVALSTDDVRACGLHVVRVLVPGRYSNAPHGLPFLGGARMHRPMRRPVPLPH